MKTRRNLTALVAPLLLLASLHAATGCSDEFTTPGADGGAGGDGGSGAEGGLPRLKIVRVNDVAVEDLTRGVDGPVTLTFVFDQPMDPETFEGAFECDHPACEVASYTWEADNVSVVVELGDFPEVLTSEPLEPRHPVTFRLNGRLRSASGKPLVLEPASTFYRTIHFDYRLLPVGGSAYMYRDPAAYSEGTFPVDLAGMSDDCPFESIPTELGKLGYGPGLYSPMQPGYDEDLGERDGVVVFEIPDVEFPTQTQVLANLEVVKWAPQVSSNLARGLRVEALTAIPTEPDWLSAPSRQINAPNGAGAGTFPVDLTDHIRELIFSTEGVPERLAFAVGLWNEGSEAGSACASAALRLDYISW